MKVSHAWLQTYFKDPLPKHEQLAELLTFHTFEIESVEGDVLDVKVLPDRACYALSHKGIAYEVSAITGMLIDQKEQKEVSLGSDKKIEVHIENPELCHRYTARCIEGITVKESPQWLKERLEAVGARVINNIVDATNFVMLDMGQPLHAFDADKVKGIISVRGAKNGESIELLPEKIIEHGNTILKQRIIELKETDLVIADEVGPIALAGVKGGLRASITELTKNIILESATFDPSSVRKTSTVYGLRNDSSKRFENGVPAERTMVAMDAVTAHIHSINESAKVGTVTDIYPKKQEHKTFEISSDYISDMLGVTLTTLDIEPILARLQIDYARAENVFTLIIPYDRLDLTIPQDIVEEIGRIYGYEKILATVLSETLFRPAVNKEFYYINKIRDILVAQGFSEVYTYAFVPKGDIEMEKPLAADKAFLRKDLYTGLSKALELNIRNADILGLDEIKIFEIGNVFTSSGEVLNLSLGVQNIKKSKIKENTILQESIQKISDALKIDIKVDIKEGVKVFEIDLGSIIHVLPHLTEYEEYKKEENIPIFKPFSIYPFSVRDIAVFTPAGTQEGDVREIIEKESASLLVKNRLFDVFTKEDKTSYAFRMVFQSFEKTLTEEEINDIMNRITTAMNSKEGW
ncbi:phenylalanine--tRNA ligase subunit beta, partial [Patescibacteria group bacterium]|nr:phenylalanine--tRNA ligase subunit beta [Patescibacteria group bacterium]